MNSLYTLHYRVIFLWLIKLLKNLDNIFLQASRCFPFLFFTIWKRAFSPILNHALNSFIVKVLVTQTGVAKLRVITH